MGRRIADLDACTVTASRAVSELRGVRTIKEPKSRAGLRTVAFPRELLKEIQHHLDTYAEAGATGRLIIGEKGATPLRVNFTKFWNRARLAAGTPTVHLHDLRHAGNHLAAITGASTRELMARMGHSSVQAALIYQHRAQGRDRAIADAIGRMLSAKEPDTQET